MRILHASKCTLEPQIEAHAEEMFEVLSDPAIYEFENEVPPSAAWLANRYAHLESRMSTDGAEKWLNWVIRLPGGELAGYVQATVLQSGSAFVAYVLASRYWRQGIGRSALQAMLEELETRYHIRTFVAVFKSANNRSLGLLHNLGFTPASSQQVVEFGAESDEMVMVKTAEGTENVV